MAESFLKDLPQAILPRMVKRPPFADIALTATAKDFAGICRGQKYHDPDMHVMLDRAYSAGVMKVLLTGMSLKDIDFNLQTAQSRPKQCFMTIGVHPYHAAEPEQDSEYFDQMFRRISRTAETMPEVYGFIWASFEDFVQVIKSYLPSIQSRGIVHSFVGSTAEMRELVQLGFGVSVNGFSFRDRESIEMVRELPLDKLQLETDAPCGEIPATSEVAKRYLKNASPLPPSKKRDKYELGFTVKGRNESCTMERVAMIVARLKGISVDEVVDAAWENSLRMFKFGD